MNVKPQAMPQRMHVTLFGLGIAQHGWVSHGFEHLAGAGLEVRERDAGFQFGVNLVEHGTHVLIQVEDFIRGIAQAPGAGEIIEVSAARFTGEDVEHDGLPQAQRVAGCAAGMRNAGIAANGKDGVLQGYQRRFRSAMC
jgi:hypothetical protein